MFYLRTVRTPFYSATGQASAICRLF